MSLPRCVPALVFLSILSAFSSDAQAETPLPTDTEINLVLTQAERAIQLYKPLIDQEETLTGKSGTDAAANDRNVVGRIEMAIKAFKGKPQGFNGPLGFAFFEWLDDASRNAALCAGGSANETMAQILAGNKDKVDSLLHLGQACADVSVLIYTVSENAGSLYQTYVEAEEQLAAQAVDVAEKCANILKNNGVPTQK